MATVTQFIAKPKASPVTLFAGPNELLRSYAQRLLYESYGEAPNLEYYSGQSTSDRLFMERVGEVDPFGQVRTLVALDAHRWGSFELLESYAANPLPRTHVVLQTPSVRRQDGKRWVTAKSKGVTTVECGNVSESALTTLIKTVGKVDEETATQILQTCAGDVEEILVKLDWCRILRKPPVEVLLGRHSGSSILSSYGVTSVEGRVMLAQARRRLLQLARLSSLLATQRNFRQIASDMEIEPFQVGLWTPIAKSASTQEWFRKLLRLSHLDRYTEQPGFSRYLELALGA